MRIYVDGVQRGSRSASGNITSYATPLRVGTNGGLGEDAKGLVDDVRIYNRALSATEVATLFSGG